MDIRHILSKCDHTLLSPDATREDILALCDDGIRFGVASVCIPPSYVSTAKEYLDGRLPICTVIGFPLGYSSVASKVCEAGCAIADGADEIDMVINISMAKNHNYQYIEDEILSIREATMGKILKVIIETALLTEEEIIALTVLVSRTGADYIKTSTGFSTRGATRRDIQLFRDHKSPELKIKAAGGISSIADAEDFIALGADRLGTSRIVKLLKNGGGEGY